MGAQIKSFFDEATYTATHIVSDRETGKCAIIDSVLDFETASGRTSTRSADQVIGYIQGRDLEVEWILETHAHADHLSAAPYLKEKLGGKTGIGAHIKDVQRVFKKIFNLEPTFQPDGSQFDRLFEDGERFQIGELEVNVMHTPGHTPACVTYVIDDAAFVGDTLFMPDYGTARADFPGGDAATLYQSIQKIFRLPPETRLFLCHDYKAPGRDEFKWETTVADEKANNIHLGGGVPREDFAKMREERDATLSIPRLILPSVQVNIRAGALPPAEDNGVSYLKLPLNRF